MNLKIDEASVERALKRKLEEGLKGMLFSVRTDVKLSALFVKTVNADIAIFDVDGKPVAVFEVKGFPQAWALRMQMDSSLSRTFQVQGVRYSIITDGDEFWMWSQESREYIKTDFDKVLDTIIKGLPVLGEVPTTEQIIDAIVENATKVTLKQKNAIKTFIEKHRARSLFKTNATTGKIEFATPSAEDAFFSYLLNGRIPAKLCRFTTRHNLFLLFKDGKQNMCSIVCMNDKSEETYADKKTGLGPSWGETKLENNNCFILSLMPQDKSDDLTMWRLYGDDAKGVCLNYEIKDKKRGRKLKGDFYLSCISYGESDKVHRELDFICNVGLMNINHWQFQFNRWHIWKHFFKSFRFRDEKEVRLLYLSDSKKKEEKRWIENSESGIVSKMMLFPMIPTNTFPLNLTNVIVGPKAPEPRKIAEQFSFIVSQEWSAYTTPILIRQSDIKEYR